MVDAIISSFNLLVWSLKKKTHASLRMATDYHKLNKVGTRIPAEIV